MAKQPGGPTSQTRFCTPYIGKGPIDVDCRRMKSTLARQRRRETTDMIVTMLLRAKSNQDIKPVRVAVPGRSRFHSNHGATVLRTIWFACKVPQGPGMSSLSFS